MPLSTTRLALPHVGTAGDQRPHPAACADPQVRGVLWRGQLEQRSVRAHDVQGVQRPDLPTFSQATAAPTSPTPTHDRGARQRPLSSCSTAGPIPARACSTPETSVSATLQSAARFDRASLETDSTPGDPQPLLRDPRRGAPGRQCLLRPLASAESNLAQAMLHYLRRCV